MMGVRITDKEYAVRFTLQLIATDTCLLQYSWNGTKPTNAFKKLKNLRQVMLLCIQRRLKEFSEKDLKHQTQMLLLQIPERMERLTKINEVK